MYASKPKKMADDYSWLARPRGYFLFLFLFLKKEGGGQGEGVDVVKKAEAARVRLDILSSHSNSLYVWLEVSRQHIRSGQSD